MLPPNYVAPNPYAYPTIVEKIVVDRQGREVITTHEFSDLQQAWCWAREQTGVEDFPFQEQADGVHAGWEFMSFSKLKECAEENPDWEFDAFYKEDDSVTFTIFYKQEDEEDAVPPPGGEPIHVVEAEPAPAPAPAITAEDCFAH